jgi:hypothetical protein
MGFFDSLMQNPRGSGIYGDNGPSNLSNELGTFMSVRKKQREDDENQGYRQANFQADLSNRMNRMNSIYGDNPMSPGMGKPGGPTGLVTGLNNPQMQTEYKENPGTINPLQRETLNLKKEDLANDREKIRATTALAKTRLGLSSDRLDLDTEKNQNIYDTKQADLQRKKDEADARLKLSEGQLKQKTNDAATQIQWHKDKMAADEARHQLEMAQKDAQLSSLQRYRDQQIEAQRRRGDLSEESTTTAERDDQGNVTKSTTKKGGSKTSDEDPFGIR